MRYGGVRIGYTLGKISVRGFGSKSDLIKFVNPCSAKSCLSIYGQLRFEAATNIALPLSSVVGFTLWPPGLSVCGSRSSAKISARMVHTVLDSSARLLMNSAVNMDTSSTFRRRCPPDWELAASARTMDSRAMTTKRLHHSLMDQTAVLRTVVTTRERILLALMLENRSLRPDKNKKLVELGVLHAKKTPDARGKILPILENRSLKS
jgi:hypothetical protein